MARLVNFTPTRGTGRIVQITPASINAIENYILWAETEVPRKVPIYMDRLAAHMAMTNQAFSRKMSFGPYDPTGMNTALAWRTPDQGIRRISQSYYLGWKMKKLGRGWFRVYNDSREAYFIEFGISTVGFGGQRRVPSRRIRRPVRKLAMVKTLRFMEKTWAYHRIWADVFKSKNAHGGFTQIVQAPAGGHERWEDITEHEAFSQFARNRRAGSGTVRLRHSGGSWQRRVRNRGSGTFNGPQLGSRLP